VRTSSKTIADGPSPLTARRSLMHRSRSSEDRGVSHAPDFAAPSSELWRGRAGYALLGTAVLTSPVVLPFELALLMLALHGTPLGAAISERLHLVYIGSLVYCLAAFPSVSRLPLGSGRGEIR
jgi:hypothetical protein